MSSIQKSPLYRLFDVIDDLVDDHVGIIRGVSEMPIEAGAPEFFHYVAEACNTSAFSSQRNFAESGGVSTDRRIAMAKAIGEAVERYCSTFYSQLELPLATSSSVQFPIVEPREFALFSPGQYRQPDFCYAPFTSETQARWTEATELASQVKYQVPACMVYVPYHFQRGAPEQAITQPISTGLACHCSWTEAAISAICEVIERDAFTITWQAMVPAPPIRIESLSVGNRDLVKRFERAGGSIRILDLTLDHGVPCVLSIFACDEPEAPALVFAASCALSAEEAVRKSLEELAHTHRAALRCKTSSEAFVPRPDYSNVTNQKTHFRLYTEHAYRHLAEFLWKSEQWKNVSEVPDLSDPSPQIGLRNLVQAIASRGYKILVKDLTTIDVRSLGLSVVRAIIPGFHPLFMGHRNRALGGTRLWTVPQSLGYEGIVNVDNEAPHPYP